MWKSITGTDSVFSSLLISPLSQYRKNYSKKDFLNAYDISLYANKAITKRADKVGDIEFILKKGDTVIENHQILDLLKKPNSAFTGAEFWKLYQKYMDIFGEVYLVKDSESRMGGQKRINELKLLRPDLCNPFFNKETGELLRVELKTGDGDRTYQADEIIYARNPDPTAPLRGESLLKAGIRQIETSTQIDEYHSKVLENGGRVEGIFNFKSDRLNKTQLDEMKDAYQEQYGNAKKSGLPLFLGGDAQYTRLGLDPAELAYLETKQVNLDDIVYLTGVPKAVLGITSGETFANADAAIRIFLRETIKPLLIQLTTKLNEDLVDEGLELGFVDPTPEDKEEKRKELETADKINAMTINEKREAIGLDPIEGGDVILTPMNLMPFNRQPEQIAPPEEKSIKKFEHPLRNKETRKIYHALQLKRLDRRQLLVQDAINEYFTGQKERIIERIQVRKQFKVKELLGEVFNKTLEIKLAKETVLPILDNLLRQAGEDSKEISGSDFEFNNTATVSSWLDKKTEVFAEQINDTTFKKLKGEFQESLDTGETRQDLIKRVENTYENSITKERAAMIARTEVHGVTQYGTLEGYKQAGVPIKIWTHVPGLQGGVRESHQALDGQEVPIDTAFSNGLQLPGSGSAGEVINCECTI